MWDSPIMTSSPVLFEFVETAAFTRRLVAFSSRELLTAIQSDLVESPMRWPVIPKTHGARKGRAADEAEGRGKRGGYRYLYLFLPNVERIYLLFIFDKHEQGNLSPEQVKTIAKWCDQIREETQ
jgi:mRNA-degrading endonuclease RelE of RelBE toxin-antitoxin system